MLEKVSKLCGKECFVQWRNIFAIFFYVLKSDSHNHKSRYRDKIGCKSSLHMIFPPVHTNLYVLKLDFLLLASTNSNPKKRVWIWILSNENANPNPKIKI